MPRIEARRASACVACSEGILKGEVIEYEREVGARHLACAERATDARRNAHPARCYWCGGRVGRGQGELTVVDRGPDQRPENRVRCLDAMACDERVRGRV